MKKINSNVLRENSPIKWVKHLTLVQWKLRDMDDLIKSINRYHIEDYKCCLADIREQLKNNESEYSFVVILVYTDSYLKLPNLVVSSLADLVTVESKLRTMNLNRYQEIWYCKNKADDKHTVFGRVSFGNDALFPTRNSMYYEIVWGASARKIEQYPAINTPFISLYRDNWNSELQFDKINLGGMNKREIIDTAEKIISEVSKNTFEIMDFASFVFSCGCNHLSLEFTYSDGKFSFIDWDSDDDMKVLRLNLK